MSVECFREARFRLVTDPLHRSADRQALRIQQLRRTKDAASCQVAHRRFADTHGEAPSKRQSSAGALVVIGSESLLRLRLEWVHRAEQLSQPEDQRSAL